MYILVIRSGDTDMTNRRTFVIGSTVAIRFCDVPTFGRVVAIDGCLVDVEVNGELLTLAVGDIANIGG